MGGLGTPPLSFVPNWLCKKRRSLHNPLYHAWGFRLFRLPSARNGILQTACVLLFAFFIFVHWKRIRMLVAVSFRNIFRQTNHVTDCNFSLTALNSVRFRFADPPQQIGSWILINIITSPLDSGNFAVRFVSSTKPGCYFCVQCSNANHKRTCEDWSFCLCTVVVGTSGYPGSSKQCWVLSLFSSECNQARLAQSAIRGISESTLTLPHEMSPTWK